MLTDLILENTAVVQLHPIGTATILNLRTSMPATYIHKLRCLPLSTLLHVILSGGILATKKVKVWAGQAAQVQSPANAARAFTENCRNPASQHLPIR